MFPVILSSIRGGDEAAPRAQLCPVGVPRDFEHSLAGKEPLPKFQSTLEVVLRTQGSPYTCKARADSAHYVALSLSELYSLRLCSSSTDVTGLPWQQRPLRVAETAGWPSTATMAMAMIYD